MKKNGDLSINIIVITVIALVVLILITFIFTGRITLFNKGLSDCLKIQGNRCNMGPNCDENYIKDSTRVCLNDDSSTDTVNACCSPLPTFAQ
ncbi:hypothetical protein J4232_01260 [Candidatus Woesearchaeota archaeon]|nr:hypothetical protein [Candidatus Woesearchaeota archaeon]